MLMNKFERSVTMKKVKGSILIKKVKRIVAIEKMKKVNRSIFMKKIEHIIFIKKIRIYPRGAVSDYGKSLGFKKSVFVSRKSRHVAFRCFDLIFLLL